MYQAIRSSVAASLWSTAALMSSDVSRSEAFEPCRHRSRENATRLGGSAKLERPRGRDPERPFGRRCRRRVFRHGERLRGRGTADDVIDDVL
jgi:hypothetical protein